MLSTMMCGTNGKQMNMNSISVMAITVRAVHRRKVPEIIQRIALE
jgi:hypothetical protein